MQKLILTFRTGEGEPCGSYLVVLPFEYESVEQWVIDFEDIFKKAVEAQKDPKSQEYEFIFPGVEEDLGVHNFIWTIRPWETKEAKLIESLEEFMEVNDMQIAELDTWFEHKKGSTI